MPDKEKYAFLVSVEAAYVAEDSVEEDNQFSFAYTVTITNIGSVAAQLISRHWIMTDENNQTIEVKGLGVIGAQPLLQPNESFKYTSGTVLATATGTMRGSYFIVATDGTRFDAVIEPFMLSGPRVLH